MKRFFLTIALLIITTQAQAATLISSATGDWSDAATWQVVDSTSMLDVYPPSVANLSTTYTSSQAFAPGAIEIDAIAVSVYATSGATKKVSLRLYNGTDAAAVAGTEVTIDASLLYQQYNSSFVYHPTLFAFASPVTLIAGKAYQVQLKVDGGSGTVTAARNSTASNWVRWLRTTTTQAPTAGDRMFVIGEFTGDSATTTWTVTQNDYKTKGDGEAPNVASTDATVGTIDWSDINNIKDSDDTYAVATDTVANMSYYAKAQDMGFAIPATATIVGIRVYKKQGGDGDGAVKDYSIKLIKADGTFSSEDKADGSIDWKTTSEAYYGNSTTLWGETWTPANINDADFGVAISAMSESSNWSAQLDYVTITVYYTDVKDYGDGSITVPSIVVGRKGALSWKTDSARDYHIKLSGMALISDGGVMSMGTEGTPVEATASNTLEFDSPAVVQYGFISQHEGLFEAWGNDKTSWTLLTSPAAATDTVLTVADTTGWAAGDTIFICDTTRGATNYTETRTIASVDSSTQVTITAGLTYAHLGTSPYQAEVGNITRNITIKGASDAYTGYGISGYAGHVDLNRIEYTMMGHTTNDGAHPWGTYVSSGFYAATVASNLAVVKLKKSAFHHMTASQARVRMGGVTTFYINDNVFFANKGPEQVRVTAGAYADSEIKRNLFVEDPANAAPGSTYSVALNSLDIDFSGNHIVRWPFGMQMGGYSTGVGVFEDNVIHSQRYIGLNISAYTHPVFGEIKFNNLTTWFIHETYGALHYAASSAIVFDGYRDFGSFRAINITTTMQGSLRFMNSQWNGFNDGVSTYNTDYVLYDSGGGAAYNVTFENCDFGKASGVFTGINTVEFYFSSAYSSPSILCKNCYFSTATEVGNYTTNVTDKGFISSQTHDNTSGLNKSYRRNGILLTDTTIYSTASPSLRMTPNNGTYKLRSNTGDENFRDSKFFTVPVAKGSTATITLKVRESVAGDGTDYDGERIRLMLAENQMGGITDNTVLATATVASEGAWETISGTTAEVAEDTVLEFYADCGGSGYTGGWANIDDFTATVTDSKGFKYFYNGTSYVVGDNSTGGGTATDLLGVIQ